MADRPIYLDDMRPHLVISGTGTARVLPCSLVEDLIAGRTALADVEEGESMMRDILADWYFRVCNDD